MRNAPASIARVYGVQALLLFTLLLFVAPGFFLRGEVIAPGDILFQIRPWSEYAPTGWERPQNALMLDIVTAFYHYYAATQDALAQGYWPLWSTLEYGGLPLLANCQSAVFYLPRLLHLFFGLELGQSLYVLLKLWLCGMVGFLCMRALDFRLWTCRFFSVAWMLSSFNLIWASWPLPDVTAWLPLLFLGVELILRGQYRRGTTAMALGGALSLFAGHPETAFTVSLALGLYFLLRLCFDRRWGAGLWKPIAAATIGWVFALGAFMSTLLPFAEYLLHSSTFFERPGTGAYMPLPLHAVAGFWTPHFFGSTIAANFWGDIDENVYGMGYPGILVWLGAMTLLLGGPLPRERRVMAWSLGITTGVAVVLALDLPPLNFVHGLPVFSSLRVAYHLFFMLFALPLLAAIGLERWFEAPPAPRRAWGLLLLLLPPAALLAFSYNFFESYLHLKSIHGFVERQLQITSILTVLGLAVLLAQAHRPQRRLWQACAVLLIAADLLYVNRNANPTVPPEHLFPDTALTDFLQAQDEPFRVAAAEGGLPAGLLATYGIEEWNAYDGLYPQRMTQFHETLGREVWVNMEPMCSKEIYLHHPLFPDPQFPLLERPEQFELLGTFDGIEAYANLNAKPRAYLIPGLELHATEDALYERMVDPAYDPEEAVVVVETPPLAAAKDALPRAGTSGSAEVTLHESLRVEVQVDAPAPAVLVLSDAFFPGWEARIDGAPAEIFPAYGAFRGVLVPEGARIVTFAYRPWTFTAGVIISVLTLLASLPVLWMTRRMQ